jgi:succinate dehydrogenase/fumarate reductase flavoprotein subunit
VVFAKDALHRNESCGGHFREEYQSEDGEAQRDDENFAYVAAWGTLVNQAKLFCTRTTGV